MCSEGSVRESDLNTRMDGMGEMQALSLQSDENSHKVKKAGSDSSTFFSTEYKYQKKLS